MCKSVKKISLLLDADNVLLLKLMLPAAWGHVLQVARTGFGFFCQHFAKFCFHYFYDK